MKSYKTHRTARIIAVVLAFFPILLGILGAISSVQRLNADSIVSFLISFAFIYIGRFLIGRNFVTAELNGDTLMVKRALYLAKTYSISQFKEIALISLPSHTQRRNYTLGGTPEAVGRSAGNFLLSISKNAGKNTHSGQQVAIRARDGSIFTLNSNYMNDSIELIEQLIKRSGLSPVHITFKEYFAWKRGQLEQYRSDPFPKTRKFLAIIKPYYKAKYVFFPPLIVFALLVLGLNIWFNWSHYQVKKISLDSLDNTYFESTESPVKHKYDRGNHVDIFTGGGKKLLADILIREKHYGDKNSDKDFHYSFYPYENPFYLSRMVNLDDDNEPEIIYKPKNEVNENYKVYDFNKSSLQFESKSLASYSPNLVRYIKEVKGFKHYRWSYYVGEVYLAYMLIYFLVLLVFHSVVVGMRKNINN